MKRPPVLIAAASATTVAFLAFALSFVALRDVAIAIRVPEELAWAWPIALDGAVVVATITAVAVRNDRSRPVRFYPWAVLIVFSSISLAANALHATGSEIPEAAAAWLGAVAPATLLLSVHLVVICIEHSPAPKPRASRPEPRKSATAARAAVTPSSARTGAREARQAAAQQALAAFEQHGTWPSSAEVARWLGQSTRSGRRLLNDLQATV